MASKKKKNKIKSLQRSDTVNICLTDDTAATDGTLLLTNKNSRIAGYMK